MVWPRECVVCGEYLGVDERFVCAKCLADMPLTYFWSWRENPAEMILWARTYLEGVVSLFYYSRDNDYKELLHELKYDGNVALGRWLGRMLGSYMARSYPGPEVVVPVPVHWRRKWKRGYNQAEVIARGLAEAMGGLPVRAHALSRVGYAASQTRMSVGSKWENVRDSFAPGRESEIKALEGRHVLLVDDVLTTGATVEACYNVLHRIPGIKVSYASIAFVNRPD